MVALVQIPNLPAVVALSGAEQFEAVQAGESVRVTALQIATYIQATPLAALTFTTPLVRTADNVTLTTVPVDLGGTGATSLTANGVLYGNGSGAVGASAAGVTGQVLVGNTGGPPSWAALSGIGVTSFSGGVTGLTPAASTTGAITLAGTLAVANGGTGVTGFGIAVAYTSDDALVAADNFQISTNNGAAGSVTLDLPAAVNGLQFSFVCMVAQDFIVQASGTDIIYLADTESVPGGIVSANTIGSAITLVYAGPGKWVALFSNGSWTAT